MFKLLLLQHPDMQLTLQFNIVNPLMLHLHDMLLLPLSLMLRVVASQMEVTSTKLHPFQLHDMPYLLLVVVPVVLFKLLPLQVPDMQLQLVTFKLLRLQLLDMPHSTPPLLLHPTVLDMDHLLPDTLLALYQLLLLQLHVMQFQLTTLILATFKLPLLQLLDMPHPQQYLMDPVAVVLAATFKHLQYQLDNMLPPRHLLILLLSLPVTGVMKLVPNMLPMAVIFAKEPETQ